MSNYKVEFKQSAVKEAKKLSTPVWDRIKEQIIDLAHNLISINSKPLKGFKGYYRVRIVDYRVVYSIDNEENKVVIVKIGHRKDIYRDF